MPSVYKLILFQLTDLCQIRLKLYQLRETNKDLLNDCLENLIDSYIIYLHPIKRHLLSHELPVQCSSKDDLPLFKNRL